MTLEESPNLDTPPLAKQLSERLGLNFMPAEAELFDDGPKFFAELEESIQTAEDTIEINIFSWAPDTTGMRIAELINKRAENLQRVDIRVDVLGSLLVGTKDEMMRNWSSLIGKVLGSDLNLSDLMALKDDPSVVYKWSKEKAQQFETALLKLASKELLLELNPALALLADNPKVNITFEHSPLSQMDHAKIFSFDSSKTYIGGRNIGDDYSGGYDDLTADGNGWNGMVYPDYWKDYMVKLGGKIAVAPHEHFFYAGARGVEGKKLEATKQDQIAFLNNAPGESSKPGEKKITEAIFELLKMATQEVVIEHAYLMDFKVVSEINRLADSGVSVVILKGGIESKEIDAINSGFFKQLSSAVKVVENPDVLHSKFLTVDGQYSLVGSANLTRESLYHHGEAAILVVGDGPLQRQLQLRAELLRERAGARKIAAASRKSMGGPI